MSEMWWRNVWTLRHSKVKSISLKSEKDSVPSDPHWWRVYKVIHLCFTQTHVGSLQENLCLLGSTLMLKQICSSSSSSQGTHTNTHLYTHAAVYLAGTVSSIPFSFSTLISWRHSEPQTNEGRISSRIRHWGETILIPRTVISWPSYRHTFWGDFIQSCW